MYCEVFFQITVLRKTLATFDANKRLFSGVCALMHIESAFLNKALSTNRTAVWLLPSVCALMCIQMPFLCISLSTKCAPERFLSCVTSLVYFKLTKASEALAALQAAEPLSGWVPQVVELHIPEHTQALGGHILNQAFSCLVVCVCRCKLWIPLRFPPHWSTERRLGAQDHKAVRKQRLLMFCNRMLHHFWTLLGVCDCFLSVFTCPILFSVSIVKLWRLLLYNYQFWLLFRWIQECSCRMLFTLMQTAPLSLRSGGSYAFPWALTRMQKYNIKKT